MKKLFKRKKNKIKVLIMDFIFISFVSDHDLSRIIPLRHLLLEIIGLHIRWFVPLCCLLIPFNEHLIGHYPLLIRDHINEIT